MLEKQKNRALILGKKEFFMIFSFNANGTPNGIVSERIYQGSKKANEIYFICPTASTNVVTAVFTLPGGTVSSSYPLDLITDNPISDITDALGNGVNIFGADLPLAVTENAGVVSVQFFVIDSNGVRVATASSEFTVERGAEISEPSQTSSYDEVISTLSSIYLGLTNISAALSGKTDKITSADKVHATNSSGTETAIGYTSSAVADTFMIRDANGRANVATPTAAGNIANKDYVDGAMDDIEDALSAVGSDVSDLSDDVDLLGGKVTTLESVCRGANKSVAFATYQAFITDILTRDDEYYNVGQNIYIIATEVPDLWISEVLNVSTPFTYTNDADIVSALSNQGYIYAGYYKISALETEKVNLTPYLTKAAISTTANQDGSFNLIINNV